MTKPMAVDGPNKIRYQCKAAGCGRDYGCKDGVRKHARKQHMDWVLSCDSEKSCIYTEIEVPETPPVPEEEPQPPPTAVDSMDVDSGTTASSDDPVQHIQDYGSDFLMPMPLMQHYRHNTPSRKFWVPALPPVKRGKSYLDVSPEQYMACLQHLQANSSMEAMKGCREEVSPAPDAASLAFVESVWA